jgi:hypothetical protein
MGAEYIAGVAGKREASPDAARSIARAEQFMHFQAFCLNKYTY